MSFNLTLAQIETLMKIEKRGVGYFVELKGGQTLTGNNFFFIAKQIKERFDLEVTALQLQTILDKDKS